jgi:hypothetical protein
MRDRLLRKVGGLDHFAVRFLNKHAAHDKLLRRLKYETHRLGQAQGDAPVGSRGSTPFMARTRSWERLGRLRPHDAWIRLHNPPRRNQRVETELRTLTCET